LVLCANSQGHHFIFFLGSRSYNAHPVSDVKRRTPIEGRNKNVWLFNISEDPLETNDLSEIHPDIARKLLDMLREFNKTVVPVRTPPSDPMAK
jgi:hypothetical protein